MTTYQEALQADERARAGDTPESDADAIRLEASEMLEAAIAGSMRQIENVMKGRKTRFGVNDFAPFQSNIEGALAECAVAKSLNLYWPGKGKFRGGDVGDLQVRQTPYAAGKLVIKEDDSDNAIYILATGSNGVYHVRGWIRGGDAKRAEWFGQLIPGSKNPLSYNVPQIALQAMSSLPIARG